MNKNLFFKTSKYGLLLFVLSPFFFFACKKDDPAQPPPRVSEGSTGTKTEPSLDIRDTMYYAVAVPYYLWNNALPLDFNAGTFAGQEIDALNNELEAIKAYSPFNSVNNLHYDHFSFLQTEQEYQAQFGRGVSLGFGMYVGFGLDDSLRVLEISHEAPAYSQGVRRGWNILSINDILGSSSNAQQIDNALVGTRGDFVFKSPTGIQLNLDLNASEISDDEVDASKVFNEGDKKIGYLAYNTFLTIDPKQNAPSHPQLDAAFASFAQAGITDIIIDLRYNGGGYTATSEQMANALIPDGFDKTVMYTQHYNDSLNYYYNLTKNDSIFHDTTIYVNKKNPLNPPNLKVNNVVFIVSNETASAAELLINNLQPFFPNLKMVGLGLGDDKPEDQRTTGKPFGYATSFSLPSVKDPRYELFLINFEVKNSKNEDNYVSGFTPDVQTYDGDAYDWGDPNEDGLKMALAYLNTGSFPTAQVNNALAIGKRRAFASGASRSFLKIGSSSIHKFRGMISSDSHAQVLNRASSALRKAQKKGVQPLHKKKA